MEPKLVVLQPNCLLCNQKQSVITSIDHKKNFKSNPKCTLINPGKSKIGIVIKEYIDNINKTIRENTHVNQWKNTNAVVMQFQNIENKDISSFTKLDTFNFYPSISKDLLVNAINFPKSVTPIDDKVIKTILHAQKNVNIKQK